MPKRVIDFDAMWGSDKLAACAAWAQAEYAWLYGLADASGCFELTNLRVIWGRVAAIRANLTIERLEQVFAEFQDKGLLFVWEHEGKRYAHWTGSDVPGRLPPPSWRMRLERFAPPVPKQQFAEYVARFARGRAALGGVGFSGGAQREYANRREDLKFESSNLREERGSGGRAQSSQMTDERLLVADGQEDRGFEISNLRETRQPGERIGNSDLRERQAAAEVRARDAMAGEPRNIAGGSGLKERVEGTQAQGLGLDLNLDGKWGMGRDGRRAGLGDAQVRPGNADREEELTGTDFCNSNSHLNSNAHLDSNAHSHANANAHLPSNANASSNSQANAKAMSAKELAVARELRVGQGPVCGPVGVRPEVLERARRREAARAGSRSP